MANRTGIELLPSQCRVVGVGEESWFLQGQHRSQRPAIRVRAYRSFPCATGNLAPLTAELRQVISSRATSKRAVVAIWGLRVGHLRLLLPPADPGDLGVLARREAAITSGTVPPAIGTVVSDGVLVGGLHEEQTGGTRREVCFVSALPGEIRARIQPLIDAGFSIDRVVTPAVAHAAIVRMRRGTIPGAVSAVLSINAQATGITVVRDGAVLFAREMPWGHDTAPAEPGAEPRDPSRLTEKLAAEMRRSLLFVKQNLRVDATQILVCGDMPELRTLTAPLMHELNIEVETLDSVEDLDVTRLSTLADEFRAGAGAFRTAVAIAADPEPALNLLPRESVAPRVSVPAGLKDRLVAGVVTGVLLSALAFAAIWWLGRSVQNELTGLRHAVASLEPQLQALEARQQAAALTVARTTALEALLSQGPRMARVLELIGRSAPAELAVTTLKVESNGPTWTLAVNGEAVARKPQDAQEVFGRFLVGLSTSPLLGAPSKPASFRLTSGSPSGSQDSGEPAGTGEGATGFPAGVDLARGPKPSVTASNTGLEREIAAPERTASTGRGSADSGLARDPNVNGYLWSSRARTVIPLNRRASGASAAPGAAPSVGPSGPAPSVLVFQFGFEVRK